MIDAQHTVTIDTAIDDVWSCVQDISRWADLFPGCQECELIDDNRSRWLIKVGAGGMVKAVTVHVNVDRWGGPKTVDFSYRLESESVTGSGSYNARQLDNGATEVQLQLSVEGSGQMAPMWEAMCRPLLPQMAQSFSNRLKDDIEISCGLAPTPRPSLLARLWQWLKRKLTG